jgi:hypothetical protein
MIDNPEPCPDAGDMMTTLMAVIRSADPAYREPKGSA